MLFFPLNKSPQSQFISILSPLSGVGAVAQAAEKIINNPLADITEKYLINDYETYGVYIKNLKTGETYGYNQNLKFETASLYKLWIMGAVFEKISKGELSNSSSNQQAIEKMITLSDNDSASLLVNEVGNSSIDGFLSEYKFLSSSFENTPTSTPEDIGLFFNRLYHGEIVSPTYSLKMIDILKKQTINDRLPKYLPDEVTVAHKTGELDEYKNDGGIVSTNKGDYVIIVMSKTNDPYIAAEKIAKYSEAVYSYFLSL